MVMLNVIIFFLLCILFKASAIFKRDIELGGRQKQFYDNIREIPEQNESNENRLTQIFNEDQLSTLQTVAVIYAYGNGLFSFTKLPNKIQIMGRIQCALLLFAANFIHAVDQITLTQDVKTYKASLTKVMKRRAGQTLILSLLSLFYFDDERCILPLLIRSLPILIKSILVISAMLFPNLPVPEIISNNIFDAGVIQNVTAASLTNDTASNDTISLTEYEESFSCALCDLIALPFDLALIQKSLSRFKSKSLLFAATNGVLIYVLINYFVNRLTELQLILSSNIFRYIIVTAIKVPMDISNYLSKAIASILTSKSKKDTKKKKAKRKAL